MPQRREYVASLYRDVLGREGSDQEIEGHLNNPGSEQDLRDFFTGSPEYTSTHGGQATWQDVGGQVQPTSAQPPDSPPTGLPPTGLPPAGPTGYATPRPTAPTTPPSLTAPTDPMARARTGLANVYRTSLGRDPAPGDVDKWLSGQFGYGMGAEDYDKFVAAIMGSPEARAYRPAAPTGGQSRSIEYWQSQGVPAIDIIDPLTGQTRPGWTRTADGYDRATSIAPYTGFQPRHDYSAFDTGRPQDPNRSAKDAYALLTNQAPPPPLNDRTAFRAWLNQYVVPGMNALGHRVLSVDDNGFTYTNHEGTFYVDAAESLGAPLGTRNQRLHWNATPADDATRARYANTGGPGGGSGGGSGSGGRGGAGAGAAPGGTNYSAPGGPGVFTGPLQQVGQDDFSTLITNALADLIANQGTTASGRGVREQLDAIISSGGRLPTDTRNRRFESARELMARGERTALNDARGALASRGLVSEPGNPSGAEASTIDRVATRNAEAFASALRDIGIAEDDASNTRLTNALGLAVGMDTDSARTLLATLGAGTDRQNMLAQIALESLQTNMAWNQFLAQFGLERDKTMYMIQNGQIDQLMPYLQMFLQIAQSTQRGYV